jgi:hypothetical protein
MGSSIREGIRWTSNQKLIDKNNLERYSVLQEHRAENVRGLNLKVRNNHATVI